MDKPDFFAENLKFLREYRNKTQAETSTGIGFGRTTWNNYESGKSFPSFHDLLKIARYFNVNLYELVQMNLADAHLIKDKPVGKKHRIAHLNSHRNAHLSEKNSDFLSTLNEPEEEYKVLHRVPKVITVDSQGNENVILVHVKARAGYLNGYGDPEFMQSLPAYRLPGLNNGTFRLFEVDGLSMYPTLNSGDMVIAQNVEQISVLRDDRIHVVVTKNDGVVIKRVLNRIQQDGKLILKSDNYKDRDLFPTIVCNPDDVLEIWYAIGYISRQMRPPAEMYNRLINLEGQFTLLEQKVKSISSKINDK